MLGRMILVLIFIAVAVAVIGYVVSMLSANNQRVRQQKEDITHNRALVTARYKTLCNAVDSYIVQLETSGQQAPIWLLEARVAFEDAPNDETRAYAFANLEKEFARANTKRLGH